MAIHRTHSVVRRNLVLITLPNVNTIMMKGLLLGTQGVILRSMQKLIAFICVRRTAIMRLFRDLTRLHLKVTLSATLAMSLLMVLPLNPTSFLGRILTRLSTQLAVTILGSVSKNVHRSPAIMNATPTVVGDVKQGRTYHGHVLAIAASMNGGVQGTGSTTLRHRKARVLGYTVTYNGTVLGHLIGLIGKTRIQRLGRALLMLTIVT